MVSFDYTIKEAMGLHARPAGILVKQIKPLPCNITITCGNRQADAKKMFALMSISVKCGETVTVTIDGETEEAVKTQLMLFFEENF